MKIRLIKKLRNRLNSFYNSYLSIYSRVPSYVLHTVSRPDQKKAGLIIIVAVHILEIVQAGLQLHLVLKFDHNLRYVCVCQYVALGSLQPSHCRQSPDKPSGTPRRIATISSSCALPHLLAIK
jgi:hypothetical protein